MVTLFRCGDTSIYGDDSVTPRVLTRPASQQQSANLELDLPTADKAIFWVLPRATPLAELTRVAEWLEDEAYRQSILSDDRESVRVVFGFPDGSLHNFLLGDRKGAFSADEAGLRPVLDDGSFLGYALTLDKSVLSLRDEDGFKGLVLTCLRDGHGFGRPQLRALAFREIRLGLVGSQAGVIGGTGLAGGSLDSTAPSSVERLVEAGLSNRFTYIVPRKSPLGGTEYVAHSQDAALLHGGDGGAKAARVELSLDLFDPFDTARSCLHFGPADQMDSLVLTIPTPLGHEVNVEPRNGAFVFTRQPSFESSGALGGYEDTMSLKGTFRVVSGRGEMAAQSVSDVADLGLVPGFAPSETLLRAEGSADALEELFVTFEPGPALDPRGLPPTASIALNENLAADDLALVAMPGPAHGVTSWMRVHGRGDAVMRMRAEPPSARNLAPRQAGLLAHDALDLDVDSGRAPAAQLKGFVPVLPARGVPDGARRDAQIFDAEKLSHERRKLARPAGYGSARGKGVDQLALSQPPLRSTTPLGFEIERLADGRVSAVSFAVSIDDVGELRFGLKGGVAGTPSVPGPLMPEVADALLRNRLFLVANTVPRPTGGYSTYLDGTVRVGNWPFRVGIPGEAEQGSAKPRNETLLIVKGYESRSIAELAADPMTWSGRDAFLRDPPAEDGNPPPATSTLSARTEYARGHLNEFITKARAEAKNDSSPATQQQYIILDDIFNLPTWAGVLILGCDLGLGDLPAQVQGLLGGMDLTKLRGEFVAIDVKGMPEGGSSPSSKLSALVDYRDEETPLEPAHGPEHEPEHDGSYGFKVNRLLAGFANGELLTTAFVAEVDVYLGRLFHGLGSIYQADGGGEWELKTDSIIGLTGSYTKTKVDNEIKELYTFETRAGSRYMYEALGKDEHKAVVETVEIRRVAYLTDATTELADGTGQREVISRFVLDGNLAFGKLVSEVVDIKALDFDEMGIATDFRLPRLSSDKIEGLRMFFNPGRLRFLFDTAKRLDGNARGFWSSFPLKFKAFTLFEGPKSLPDVGFFGFGNLTGTGFRYGLEFDLDLGFLGSLVPSAGFKLSVLFGFTDGFNTGSSDSPDWEPRWALGFKFPEGDGRLDIGVEGVLRLRAERFEILDRQFGGRSIKLIYALGAQMEVLGYKIPGDADLSLFIFVDPESFAQPQVGQTNSGVGWFAARRPSDGEIFKGVFKLNAIALGQHVDPLPRDWQGRTTKEFIEDLTKLTSGPGAPFGSDPGSDGQAALDLVVAAIERNAIRFAPERGWSVGFSAVFAECVELGLAMRDDDIYGMRVVVRLPKGAADPFFALDVLYRKLTDKLGVYSAEIIPPPAWRQLEFGAVSVTIPSIAFEIFTDGGFTIDLGYPFDKNYARAFGVQVFPFIGSGGLYFRRVQGPAAWLVPQPKYLANGSTTPEPNPALLTYKPVTEVGLAFRVGLGKEIIKGPFRAGLSLTVFAELQGGYGVLWRSDGFDQAGHSTRAASTFVAVRGEVGILGEVYGYVDFGIVKAGVSVRVWVATGFDLKTDHRTRLYIAAGVDVGVEVVIARFKIFGKTFEVRIHFSFSTTIEFSTYIGNDSNPEYYSFPASIRAAAAIGLQAPSQMLTFQPNPAWDRAIIPSDWRAPEKVGPLPLPIYLMADVTLAAEAGVARPDAVLLCAIPDSDATDRDVGTSEVVALLAAWAICNHVDAPPGLALRDWPVTADLLDEIAKWIAADDRSGVYGHASERRPRQPAFGVIDAMLDVNVDATLSAPPASTSGEQVGGVFLPLPPTAAIRRLGFAAGPRDVRLSDMGVVDDDYRAVIDSEMQRLMTVVGSGLAPATLLAEPAPIPIAQALFEDYIGLAIRAALAHIGSIAAEEHGSLGPVALGKLLDGLAEDPVSGGPLAAASRFALHGPRLPYPHAADPTKVPPGLDAGTVDQPAHHSLYRLAWLQLALGPAAFGETRRFVVDAGPCFLRGSSAELRVDAAAANAYDALAGASLSDLGGEISLGEAFRTVARAFSAGRPTRLAADGHLLFYPTDLVRHQAATDAAPDRAKVVLYAYPIERRADPVRIPDGDGTPVIAVRLRLNPLMADATRPAEPIDRFEIAGMSEGDRVWLDLFEDGAAEDAIADIALYAADGSGFASLGAEAGQASVVQTDLSAEPGPDDAALAAAEVSKTYVADLDAKSAFVDIVRRAGITNRAGATIGWPGAARQVPASSPDGTTPLRELLMVVHLAPGAIGHANALVFQHSDIDANAFAFQVESADAGKRAQITEPLAAPGVLPIRITRPAEARNPPVGIDPDAWQDLADGFSMFAYSVRDETGAVLVEAAKSLAVGPTQQDGPGRRLEYRLSLPAQKMLRLASPYDAVGQTLTVAGTWRDVYGNDWPGQGLAPFDVPIRYADRLIPLNDLPGIVLAWWPGTERGLIHVGVGLDHCFPDALVPRGTYEDEELPLKEPEALADRIERAAAIYGQVALQIADTRIEVAVEDSGSATATRALDGPVTLSVGQLGELRTLLGRAAAIFAGMSSLDTSMPRADLRRQIADRLTQVGQPCDLRIRATLADVGFAELSFQLSVARRFNPTLLSGEAPPPPDVMRAAVPLPLPMRDDRVSGGDNAVPPGFGRTMQDLQTAIATFAPGRLLATGHGAMPGAPERAVWLVDETVLPPLDHFGGALRHDFALPPISTSLHNFELEVPRLGQPAQVVGFKNLDADAAADKALSLYDDLLTPKVVQALAGTTAGRVALQQIIAAKAEIAGALARRLHPVFKGVTAAVDIPVKALEDRLLARLSNAGAIDAVSMVVDAEMQGEPERVGPQGFGAITIPAGDAASRTFRPFVMSLGEARKRARHIVFSTDVVPAYVNVDDSVPAPRTYVLTHVQRLDRPDITESGPGALGRYRPTAWLKFAEGRTYSLPADLIPIVHKRFPSPPAIRSEKFSPEANPTSVAAARLWSNTRDWTYEGKPVDRLKLTLRYNPADASVAGLATNGDEAAEWAKAFAMFAEAVGPVMGSARAGGEAVAQFLVARCEALARTLTGLHLLVTDALSEHLDVYSVQETTAELPAGQRRILLERSPKEVWPRLGRFRLYARPEGHPEESDDGPVSITFDEGNDLSERRRRLEALGLDILAFRTVQTELEVRRNAEIDGRPVADKFMYRLPAVTSGAPLAPLLDVTSEIPLLGGPSSFKTHLERLLAELLNPIEAPSGAEAKHEEILRELALNLVLTHEPLLSAGVDVRGDGSHVSGVVRSGLQRADWSAWADPFVAEVEAWKARWRPPGGRLVFSLRLFEAQSARPILRLRNVVLPIEQITP